jgi:hypothetical protein
MLKRLWIEITMPFQRWRLHRIIYAKPIDLTKFSYEGHCRIVEITPGKARCKDQFPNI